MDLILRATAKWRDRVGVSGSDARRAQLITMKVELEAARSAIAYLKKGTPKRKVSHEFRP